MAQQDSPFPPARGVAVGVSPQGRECRAALSPSPGPGPPLCRQTPHVKPGARGQQVLCSPRHRGKATPSSRREDRLCGEGSTGATEDTGLLSSGADGSTPGLPPGATLWGGHLPRELSPPEEGGLHTVCTAVSTQLRSSWTPPGLKGPGGAGPRSSPRQGSLPGVGRARGPCGSDCCAPNTRTGIKETSSRGTPVETAGARGRVTLASSLPSGLTRPSRHAQSPGAPKQTRPRRSVSAGHRATRSQGCGRPFLHGHHQRHSGKHGACSPASAPTVGPPSTEHCPLVSQPDAGDSRSFFKMSQWLTLPGKPCQGLETRETRGGGASQTLPPQQLAQHQGLLPYLSKPATTLPPHDSGHHKNR